MSSTGFGEDRPYGAIDDDDDFIEEWRSSWEPTPRSHINEVIEPVVVSVPEPEPIAEYAPETVTEAPVESEAPAVYQLSDLELERVYEQGLYAPSVSEPVAQSVEEQAAFEEPAFEQPVSVVEEPAASPYDIEAIHAGIATDPTLQSLAATVVAAHPLTPVVTPEPIAEQWTPPVAPEPLSVPETEPVAEAPEAPAAEAFAEFAAPAEPEAPTADTFAEAEESVEPVVEAVPEVSAAEEIAAPETMYEQPGAWQPADDTAASEVPTATPFADTETVEEPEVAPLEAPDDYDGMELVEWEPEPLAAFGPPAEVPAVEAEAVRTIESFTALPELSDVPAEQVSDATPAAEFSPAPAPVIEPEPEIAPEPATESLPEATPEPIAEATAESAPEPTSEPVAEPEPIVEYEAAAEYASPAEPTEDPDHSVGLTGAAAAALAAAAAWGVWGQPAASVAEPFVEPEPYAEPEPEPYAEPEPEPYAEPEPEPYAEPEPIVEPEPYEEPEPHVAPAVSDSETWVATSMDTTPIPEPEAVSAPEPDAWATSDLETTPIPEPEAFTPTEPEALVAAEPEASDEILDADSTFTIAPVVAPELSAHEQVHAWADQTTTYDLQVDVTSILGTAMRFAPAEVSGVAPQAADPQRQVIVNDELAEAIFHRPPDPEPPAESPFAPPPAPIDVESPFAAAAEPVEMAPFAGPADTYALPSYEPVEIHPYESSYAPVEPSEAAPAATEAPATVEAAWPEPVPSAQAWPTEATAEATPAAEHEEAPHEHGGSGWLERAKARVADIYYDPDADAPVIAEDVDGQTR